MSLAWIYIICLITIFLVTEIGALLKISSQKRFHNDEGIGSKKQVIGINLVNKLIEQCSLKNVKISKLNASKTNYYSFKYNVIKLAPVTYYSYEFSQLSIVSHCFRQAKFAQKHTFFSMIYIFLHKLSKITACMILPIILIFSIITSIVNANYCKWIIFVAIMVYLLFSLIEFSLFFIKKIRTKYLLTDLRKINLFDNDELEIMEKQLKSIANLEFYEFSSSTLFIFKLFNPDIIFKPSKN